MQGVLCYSMSVFKENALTKKFVVDYLRDGTSYSSSDLNFPFFFLLLTTVKQIEVIEVTSATIATTIVREPSEKIEPVKEEFEILTKFLLVKVELPNSQFVKEIFNSLFSPEKKNNSFHL